MVTFVSESLILKKIMLNKKKKIHLQFLFSINERKKVCGLAFLIKNYFFLH